MRSMIRAGRRWAAWFDAPAPALRLARFRMLVFTFACAYLVIRVRVFAALGDDGGARWEPVGVLWWSTGAPPVALVRVVLAVTVAGAALAAAGVWYRISGPLAAVGMLLLTTIRSSTGQLLWFENLVVLHLLIVGCSPAADAAAWRTRCAVRLAVPDTSWRYGRPLRLACVVTALTYALAGVAKLRHGGIGWLDGESLRRHVAFSATRLEVLGGTPSPLAAPLLDIGWVFGPLAVVTLLLELGAPLVLLHRRFVVPWVAGVWLMHASIAATMAVVFPYPLVLVAFAPFFRLERSRGLTDHAQ